MRDEQVESSTMTREKWEVGELLELKGHGGIFAIVTRIGEFGECRVLYVDLEHKYSRDVATPNMMILRDSWRIMTRGTRG